MKLPKTLIFLSLIVWNLPILAIFSKKNSNWMQYQGFSFHMANAKDYSNAPCTFRKSADWNRDQSLTVTKKLSKRKLKKDVLFLWTERQKPFVWFRFWLERSRKMYNTLLASLERCLLLLKVHRILWSSWSRLHFIVERNIVRFV